MTSATFACHGYRNPKDRVAVGADGSKTFAELQADVARVMAQLADVEHVVIACEDRYRFTVAVLAAWQVGACVVLSSTPEPNAAPGTKAQLHPLRIHDGHGVGTDVRVWLASPYVGLASLEPLPAEQCLVTLSTSGSTGTPLFVDKRARQLLGEARDLRAIFDPQTRTVLSTVPARHIYGLLFGVLAPLQLGVSFVRETPLMPEAIIDCARRYEAESLVAVPAHLSALAAVRTQDVGPLRYVFSSGAPLPPACFSELVSRFGLAVTEVLGSTETGGIAFRRVAGEPFTPFAGITVRANELGDLSVASPYIEGSEPVVTGDRVELLADGRFVHLGRTDGVVKVGGTRISLAAIEERARSLPGVSEVAALSVERGATRGHEIWLAVVADGWDTQRMRRALREWFEPVVLPRRFRFVERLPRDDNGKLPQAALRALFDTEESSDVERCKELEVLSEQRTSSVSAEVVAVELRVPPELVFFQGHFPNDPILPGVVQLQVVVMDQARRVWPALGPLREVRRLKFTRPIRPGEILSLKLTRVTAGRSRIDFTLAVMGEAAATGTAYFAEPGTSA